MANGRPAVTFNASPAVSQRPHLRTETFAETEHGAHVGDLFMSLIHTCELNGVNPFDYLTELNKHADELSPQPADWMPWTYRNTLDKQVAPKPI